MIRKSKNMTDVLPMFAKNKFAIACSSSVEYAPYLSVYLQSIKEHASSKNTYDIIVFESSWTNDLRKQITDYFNSDNFSVRFVNPEYLFDGVDLYTTHSYFKRECYFRISAPEILNHYDKILFTDIDLVAMNDIANIFKLDLNGNVIAASLEPIYKNFYYANRTIAGINIREYTDDVLQIKPENYYNTGVLLIDVKKYLQQKVFYKLLDLIKENRFIYQEQCALNKFFRNKIATLPIEWNYEVDRAVIDNPKYSRNITNVNICHFLGRQKPWFFPNGTYCDVWWNYARRTPFYEEIESRKNKNDIQRELLDLRKELANVHFVNINNRFVQNEENIKLLFVMNHMLYFKLKKWFYKIICLFTFGSKRDKYKQKVFKLRDLIKNVRKFRHHLFKG